LSNNTVESIPMLQCSLPKADIVLYPKEFKTKPISRKHCLQLVGNETIIA
jgi:hypothetical protein